MMKLIVEVNPNICKEKPVLTTNFSFIGSILITPLLGEDYWTLRCKVSSKQAILVFPKFGLYGCGFSKEKNWNTNLPIGCQEEEIWNHIKENRAGANIKTCQEALHLLREAAKQIGLFNEEMESRLK